MRLIIESRETHAIFQIQRLQLLQRRKKNKKHTIIIIIIPTVASEFSEDSDIYF